MATDKAGSVRPRIHSIDILRGFIMIVMALDHTRDFFYPLQIDPLDLAQTSPQLFLTRWITHYCAPVFVFLAGTSAFLSLGKYGSRKAASRFLLKRGVWIILLELLIVNLSWSFDLSYANMVVQVFWAIGWSMIALAAIIWLPLRAVAALGILIVVGHNLLDPVLPADLGAQGWVWMMIHDGGYQPFSETRGLFFGYPILPWIGVMACGYAFGKVYQWDPERRRRLLLLAGSAFIVLFLVLRYSGVYGNEASWTRYAVWWKNMLSFINCNKYPPSFLYLLMTMGPAFIALALLERTNNKLSRFCTVYGRVPMFYYLLHVPLIHILAIFVAFINGNDLERFFDNMFFDAPDPAWGFNLPVVYFVWLLVVIILYYPCRWFMRLKSRRKDWWLSYL